MPLQFLSETGIVGFLLYVGVIAAGVIAVLRRDRTRVWLALSLAVALCVVHSFVDIDWDFLAVLGPFFLTVGALVSPPVVERSPVTGRRWLTSAAVGVCAVAALYSLASPWLATNRVSASLDALTNGNLRQARTDALSARAFNPLSVDALFAQALVERNAQGADAVQEGCRPRAEERGDLVRARLLRADELAPAARCVPRPESRVHARPQHLRARDPAGSCSRRGPLSDRPGYLPKMSTRCAPSS